TLNHIRRGAADIRLVSHTRSDYCVFASLTRWDNTRSTDTCQSPVLGTKGLVVCWVITRRISNAAGWKNQGLKDRQPKPESNLHKRLSQSFKLRAVSDFGFPL